MLCDFLTSSDPEAQRYGASTLARSTRTQQTKKTVTSVGGTKQLLELLDVRACYLWLGMHVVVGCSVHIVSRARSAVQTSPHAYVIEDIMHCLLNLTTEASCQLAVGKYGIDVLIEYARASDSSKMREYASRILKNLATNGANRTRLYKAELRAKKRDWQASRNHARTTIDARPRPPSASTVSTLPRPQMDTATSRPACLDEYNKWVQRIGAADIKYVLHSLLAGMLVHRERAATHNPGAVCVRE
mgnify:CR=1 FL=1